MFYQEIISKYVTSEGYKPELIFLSQIINFKWKTLLKKETEASGIELNTREDDNVKIIFTTNCTGDLKLKPHILHRRDDEQCHTSTSRYFIGPQRKDTMVRDSFTNDFVRRVGDYCIEKKVSFKALIILTDLSYFNKQIASNTELLHVKDFSLRLPMRNICNAFAKLYYRMYLKDTLRSLENDVCDLYSFERATENIAEAWENVPQDDITNSWSKVNAEQINDEEFNEVCKVIKAKLKTARDNSQLVEETIYCLEVTTQIIKGKMNAITCLRNILSWMKLKPQFQMIEYVLSIDEADLKQKVSAGLEFLIENIDKILEFAADITKTNLRGLRDLEYLKKSLKWSLQSEIELRNNDSTLDKNIYILTQSDLVQPVLTDESDEAPTIVEETEQLLATWLRDQWLSRNPMNRFIALAKAKVIYDYVNSKHDNFLNIDEKFPQHKWYNKFEKKYNLEFAGSKRDELFQYIEENKIMGALTKYICDEGYIPELVFNMIDYSLCWGLIPNDIRKEASLPKIKYNQGEVKFILTTNGTGDLIFKPILIHNCEDKRDYTNKSLKNIGPCPTKKFVRFTETLFRNYFIPQVEDYCKLNNHDFKVLLIVTDSGIYENDLDDVHPNIKVIYFPTRFETGTRPKLPLQHIFHIVSKCYSKNLLMNIWTYMLITKQENGSLWKNGECKKEIDDVLKIDWAEVNDDETFKELCVSYLRDYSFEKAMDNVVDCWENLSEDCIRQAYKDLLLTKDNEDDTLKRLEEEIKVLCQYVKRAMGNTLENVPNKTGAKKSKK